MAKVKRQFFQLPFLVNKVNKAGLTQLNLIDDLAQQIEVRKPCKVLVDRVDRVERGIRLRGE